MRGTGLPEDEDGLPADGRDLPPVRDLHAHRDHLHHPSIELEGLGDLSADEAYELRLQLALARRCC